MKDAANRSDPHTTSQKHRRSNHIMMQRERSPRAADYEPVAKSGKLKNVPECMLTCPHRNHDWTLALGRACDREGQGTANIGPWERARGDKVGVLSSSKFEGGII